MGIIWGSIWAYFGKRGHIFARIFGYVNQTVLRAFFCREKGNLGVDFYDGGCPGVFPVIELLPTPRIADTENASGLVYPRGLHKFKPIYTP